MAEIPAEIKCSDLLRKVIENAMTVEQTARGQNDTSNFNDIAETCSRIISLAKDALEIADNI